MNNLEFDAKTAPEQWLLEQLSEAQAQIAMQADAINSTLSAIKYAEQYNHLSDARDEIANAWDISETKLMEANLSTSETVAAWRAKETGVYRIFKDGSSWCAVSASFRNLQESVSGFGDSPMEALGALIVDEGEK